MKIWQRRVLGILTLGGGAVGFVAGLQLVITRETFFEWVFCLAFMAIYSWGVWCGVRLLEQQPNSERPIFWYWLLQVPVIGSPVVGYFMSSGFYITLTLQILPLKFNANFLLGSTFQYSFMQQDQPWLFGINIFAAGVAWWLSRQVSSPAS